MGVTTHGITIPHPKFRRVYWTHPTDILFATSVGTKVLRGLLALEEPREEVVQVQALADGRQDPSAGTVWAAWISPIAFKTL